MCKNTGQYLHLNCSNMFPSDTLVFLAAENTVGHVARGGYAKKILVLALAEPNSVANQAFIAKVLLAAGLQLEQDCLFAEISTDVPVNCFGGMPERPAYILVFGLPPAQTGISAAIQPYQTAHFHGATWLFADAISLLEPDPVRKKKLWEALKPVFVTPA
jgi:hypothetical protein